MELIAAMGKFLQLLQLTRTTHPKAASEWISFADVQVQEDGEETLHDDGTGKPAVAETKPDVAVLRLDKNIGTQLNVQVAFPIAAVAEIKVSAVAVPWAVARAESGHGCDGCRQGFRSRGFCIAFTSKTM